MANPSVDLTELNELFRVYSSVDLAEVSRNDAAYANEVYDLTDVQGDRFVMRILRIQDPATVNLEASMQTKLNAAGITSPQYLELSDNNYVGEKNGRHFTLSRHIEGSVPSEVKPELVRDFGATLARIHDCLEDIVVPPNKMQWFDPKIAQEDLDSYDGPLKSRLNVLVRKGDELLNRGLPQAVIHGDLWRDNIFASGSKVTAVFDFETAQNTARIIDLARTYTSMRRETDLTDQQIIDLLIDGYDSVAAKPLTADEKDSFRLAIAYVSGVVAAWHAANSTVYTEIYIEMGEKATQ